jgi:glycosyltransferase involved in cell wall biosynthesis
MRSLSVIIPVFNEEKTLKAVITGIKLFQPLEIIVVANGCTDHSSTIAKENGCIVIEHTEKLGQHLARVEGAKKANGDVLLFLDADFALPFSELQQFLTSILFENCDVTVNQNPKEHSSTEVWKKIVAEWKGHKECGKGSFCKAPFALTKEVLVKSDFIKSTYSVEAFIETLKVAGRIEHRHEIDTKTLNRFRPSHHNGFFHKISCSEKRVIKEHVESISKELLRDKRGGYKDAGRNREILAIQNYNVQKGWGVSSTLYGGQQLSVIVPAQNEAKYIKSVISQARQLEPLEIIVVINGSTDETEEYAKSLGATVVLFEHRLGHDVGRGVGASLAQGDILLFVDSDFTIPAQDLFPFAKAVQSGIDVALNKQLDPLTHPVPLWKYALNVACDHKKLETSSLVAVPHAMSKKVVESIGYNALAVPPLAQCKAMKAGFLVEAVHAVDVHKLNAIRLRGHFAQQGYPPTTELIVGDFFEAIHYLAKL